MIIILTRLLQGLAENTDIKRLSIVLALIYFLVILEFQVNHWNLSSNQQYLKLQIPYNCTCHIVLIDCPKSQTIVGLYSQVFKGEKSLKPLLIATNNVILFHEPFQRAFDYNYTFAFTLKNISTTNTLQSSQRSTNSGDTSIKTVFRVFLIF